MLSLMHNCMSCHAPCNLHKSLGRVFALCKARMCYVIVDIISTATLPLIADCACHLHILREQSSRLLHVGCICITKRANPKP